jgi:hypothetical protein
MPVVAGYCGVASAELAPIRTGDLGRCETAVASEAGTAVSPCYALAGSCRLGLRRPLSVLPSWASTDGLL